VIFDAIGVLALGELPIVTAAGSPVSHYLGYVGRTRRLDDMELQLLAAADPDFDIERAIALWLMWNERD
jgi:hypothetical protein